MKTALMLITSMILSLMELKEGPYFGAYQSLSFELANVTKLSEDMPTSINIRLAEELLNLTKPMAEKDKRFNEVVKLLNEIKASPSTIRVDEPEAIGKYTAGLGEGLGKEVREYVEGLFSLVSRFSKYNRFIREMSLVYIVSVFESYLEKILRITLRTEPRIISGRNITMEQLNGCRTLEEARNAIIDKEISDQTLQNPENINEYFSDPHFGLELSGLSEWKSFSERFYRRHIIVHNDGIPDSKYGEKVGYTGPARRLTIDDAYLSESIALFLGVGKKIAVHLDGKFKPSPR